MTIVTDRCAHCEQPFGKLEPRVQGENVVVMSNGESGIFFHKDQINCLKRAGNIPPSGIKVGPSLR